MALTLFCKPIAHLEGPWAQMNHMKHSYNGCCLLVLMILCCLPNLSAQITLHEATNITQTKATLSADFPDLSEEHGFQYKYGTLPEIDEFSKVALAPASDPVQINTSGKAWSARAVKGWVESNSDINVGQTSEMTVTVDLTEATEISFEWSVDSEVEIGILSFWADGTKVNEISGEVGFTGVRYQAAQGKHTFKWQYSKTSETNIGLDLGMVRNINFKNTTPGEWLQSSSNDSFLNISNIYPFQNYIFRAYAENNGIKIFSCIKGFKTDDITLSECSVHNISQTSAIFKCDSDFGDALVETGFICSKTPPNADFTDFARAFLSNDTYGRSITIKHDYLWKVGSNCVYMSSYNVTPSIYISVNVTSETEMTFDWLSLGGSDGCTFYVDDKKKASTWGGATYKTVTVKLTPGTHNLRWTADYVHSYNTVGTYIRNVSIPNLAYADILGDLSIVEAKSVRPDDIITSSPSNQFSAKALGLKPNTTYYLQSYILPTYTSNLSQSWVESKSEVITFTTANLKASTATPKIITQSTATILGNVDGGDAIIVANGLQYKDAESERWTDFPKDISAKELSQQITRLKPNTKYNYRSYIQALDCDPVFSEIGELSTLAVEALKPTITKLSQRSAELQGKVIFGDASIYQRGMQFRKVGTTEWEEIEDGGNESEFILAKDNLEFFTEYEARTYVQPAGCEIIYSDILKFRTNHYVSNQAPETNTTQTSATIKFDLADTDDVIEEAGIYYGTDKNSSDDWEKEVGVIADNTCTVEISDLQVAKCFYYRPYVRVAGTTYYYDALGLDAQFSTKKVIVSLAFSDISQTKAIMNIEINSGDAVISDLRYRIDYGELMQCQKSNLLTNLVPARTYSVTIYANVNGEELTWNTNASDEAFKFTTKSVSSNISISDISQTFAKVKCSSNYGDATYLSSGLELGSLIPII